MKARTGYPNGTAVVVDILSAPSCTGLVRVRYRDANGGYIEFTRHVERLEPVDDEARNALLVWTA